MVYVSFREGINLEIAGKMSLNTNNLLTFRLGFGSLALKMWRKIPVSRSGHHTSRKAWYFDLEPPQKK